MIVGRQLVIEAIRSGKALDRIYLNTKATGEIISVIRNEATKNNIPVNYVPVEKLNGFNVENHEGVVALFPLKIYWPLIQHTRLRLSGSLNFF